MVVIHILLNIPQRTRGNNTHHPKCNTTIIHERIRLRISLLSGPHKYPPLCHIAIHPWEREYLVNQGLANEFGNVCDGGDVVDSNADSSSAEVFG